MKKFISCVVFTVMMMSLAACGGKEQSAAYTMEAELEGGVVMTDTLTLDARGDSVQQITEAVSYTHLDVYKRQVFSSLAFSIRQ